MLENLLYPRSKTFPRLLVAGLSVLYLSVFGLFHHQIGPDIMALAVFPTVCAGWYFGLRAGILAGALAILANFVILEGERLLPLLIVFDAGNWIASFSLLFIGAVVGRLGTLVREHRTTLAQLREYEIDRDSHTHFMSALNDITWAALETKNTESILNVLVKQIAELFEADDCYFALWDEANQSILPVVAYGSASETYPRVRFEAGEPTLARWILETQQPLAIPDFENSKFKEMANPKVTPMLQSKSLLGVPLIEQGHKLGIMFLSYRQPHDFSREEVEHSRLAAQQIALALTRIRSFEEAERRVKELAVLHELAVAPMQVESADQLLELATEIIGRNIFPDNFGILLLDETSGSLRFHPSYRVYPMADSDPYKVTVQLGQGITGQVAQSGKPQRIGDVRQAGNYINVDSHTRSELCVPLKSKNGILGVINAESMELNTFTVNDENLMVTLASQLATALEYLRSLEAERHWMSTLAHSNELISALSHVTTQVEKAFSPSDVIRIIEEEFRKMGLTSLLSLYRAETGEMFIQSGSLVPDRDGKAESGAFDYRVQVEKMESLFGIENILAPMVLPAPLKTMEAILGGLPSNIAAEILCAKDVTANTEIIHLPLLFEDRLLGALWLWGKDLTRADLPVMSIFAGQMAITLENARLFEEVQNLAITDPLTGLHNRRGLFEIGKIEFSRSQRTKRAFSAIMVDIDHFKQINDTYGHFTGDRVLQNFAHLCRISIRDVDLIGRYGGEEIVILLPETDLTAGVEVAERMRIRISNTPIHITDDFVLRITTSLGVAQQDENTLSLETLIERADQAMYVAKREGRNRVATSE